MIESAFTALSILAHWHNIPLILIGSLLGFFFGLIPGLNGVIAMALVIPLTFDMEVHRAMMLLLPIMGGTTQGGSISAILINTPGTAPNAATTFDGYSLAQQGKAGIAIGASATASCMGSIIGLALLVLAFPVIRHAILLFGPPEFFVIALFGLTIIGLVVEGSVLSGLIAGGVGLLLSFHGFNPVVGGRRYTFGTRYLWDGIPLIPVIMGLFAIAEAIDLGARRATISRLQEIVKGGVRRGVSDALRNWFLVLRSSVLGWFIGVIPGVGGTVASFLAYVQAMQTSKDKSTFGRGEIKGVISPEAANDAKDGGSLVPTLALGIPGSEFTAVLLGAFILHGVVPGRSLFAGQMTIVWIIIYSLILSNALTSVFATLLGPQLAKLTLIKGEYLAPAVIVLAVIGSYVGRLNSYDSVLAVIFGILGYWMKRFSFPRISIILGLVLGPIVEQSFHQAVQIARGSYSIFLTRPISAALLFLMMLAVISPFLRPRRR